MGARRTASDTVEEVGTRLAGPALATSLATTTESGGVAHAPSR